MSGCGIAFWVDAKFQRRCIETKQLFYCPNGHGMHYLGEPDAEKLIRERRERAAIVRQKDMEIARLTTLLEKNSRKPRKAKKS